MQSRLPTSTRTYTLIPYTTMFRSPARPVDSDIAVASGRLLHSRTEPVPGESTWRLFVDVQPDGKKPMDVRAHLRLHGEVLTETLNYTRSEEHKSQLQSLIRTQYAVYCL